MYSSPEPGSSALSFLASCGPHPILLNPRNFEGTVEDSKGKPVSDATVLDVPSAKHRKRTDLYQQNSRDEIGHFPFWSLNPGKYSVLAFDESRLDVRETEFLKAYEGRGGACPVR